MTPQVPSTLVSYADDVRAWSSARPWEGRPSLKHNTSFTIADVVTDGAGNIIAMPALLHKPCFGRAEVFLRHGATKTQFTRSDGKEVESLTRCGRCAKVGVRAACESVSLERVSADPAMAIAFDEWSKQTTLHKKASPCTGPIGRYWTTFREAVAARGPFDSVNDAAVAAHEAGLEEGRRQAARIKKRNQRATRQYNGQAPTDDLILAALAERKRRFNVLADLTGDPSAPRFAAKLPLHGCEITADVWLGGLLLQQVGRRAGAADIARWLVKNRRTHGVTFGRLRVRVYDDLGRVKQLEATENGPAIWAAFDPDA